MGSAGREYVPGRIHRADRMASTGLYEDGKKGIRRLTDPELRVKDQDRDGVQGEVLYGVLGATGRLNDPEAAHETMRIYNEWLADFCTAEVGQQAPIQLEHAVPTTLRPSRGNIAGTRQTPDLSPIGRSRRPKNKKSAANAALSREPSNGLEPLTPSLPWRCSTN